MGLKQWILIAVVAVVAKSWLESFLQPKLPRTVNGFCDPAFKQVGEIFRKNVKSGFEPGAAISVYYKGARVVDLWGGYADVSAQRPWAEDTITMAFSVSKGLAAIVVATLVERGVLDYKAPVTKYWPEFGQKEKGNITVEMLLSHQAGLVLLDTNFELLDLRNNREKVEQVLAAQGTAWPAGTRLGYHAITYGMYVDTLVKKVDPKGRTTGQILREDIAEVHGIDSYLNTPKDQFYRAARMNVLPMWKVLYEGIFNRKYFPVFAHMIMNPDSLLAKVGTPIKEFAGDYNKFNNPDLREIEMSSAMGASTARGLAKLYGILSNGGVNKETNKRLLTQKLVTRLSTPVFTGEDAVLRGPNTFGPGTAIRETGKKDRNFVGHCGNGGNVGFADMKNSLGIGYVTNFMSIYGLGDDPRYLALEEAIYESVRVMEKK